MLSEGVITGFTDGSRMPQAGDVAVLVDDDEVRRRIVETLRGATARLFVLPDDAPPADVRSLVLVTDRADEDDLPDELRAASERIRFATLVVGRPAAPMGIFDVALAGDLHERELLVATSLLWQLAVKQETLSRALVEAGEATRRAATDPLTGLSNRRSWDEAVVEAAAGCRRRGEPLCLALVDVDRFKRLNDEHGHAAGDAVLRAVADALRAAVRRHDAAARLGGDEFGLLLPGLSAEHAGAVVERIRVAVSQAAASAGLPPTTCSLGFAVTTPDEADAAGRLFAAADDALRRAKNAGRNRSAG